MTATLCRVGEQRLVYGRPIPRGRLTALCTSRRRAELYEGLFGGLNITICTTDRVGIRLADPRGQLPRTSR
jgi:hypothetical protein